jgi:hypothetical protein
MVPACQLIADVAFIKVHSRPGPHRLEDELWIIRRPQRQHGHAGLECRLLDRQQAAREVLRVQVDHHHVRFTLRQADRQILQTHAVRGFADQAQAESGLSGLLPVLHALLR